MNARATDRNKGHNLLKAMLLAAGMLTAGASCWAFAAEPAEDLQSPTEIVAEIDSIQTVKLPVGIAGDVLFGFNSAILDSDAKSVLAQLASQLRGAEYGIAVIGHADRLGTAELNKDLSYRRAMAVRNYLERAGVEHIAVVEDGNAEPLPITTECDDLQGNALRACLQPDRRVDIQGTLWIPAQLVVETVTESVVPDPTGGSPE